MGSFLIHKISCVCLDLKNKEGTQEISFIVCSELDESGKIINHIEKCNNCGNMHNIVELGKSILLNTDSSKSIKTIDDIDISLNSKISKILHSNKCELYIWKAAEYIFCHKLFPNILPISQEEIWKNGKPLIVSKVLIIEEDRFKIETFETDPLSIASL